MEIIKNLDSAIEYIHYNLSCEYELSNLPFEDRKGSLRIKDCHLEKQGDRFLFQIKWNT